MQIRYVAIVILLVHGAIPAYGAADAPPATGLAQQLQHAIDQVAAGDPSIPGVLASVSAPIIGLDWSGASNVTHAQATAELRADQPFRIASLTKVFTAAAVFRLFEEGRLGLYDALGKRTSAATVAALRGGGYDPEAITIQQLLAHTSGLYDYAMDTGYGAAVLQSPRKRWTRAEQVSFAMLHGRPVGSPGERYGYSDTGYVVLGDIVERASGKPLPLAIRELLDFRRLGLVSTYFETLEPAPPASLPLARQSLGNTDVTAFDPSFDLFGGGGLVSTTADINRFYRALLQGRVFKRRQTLAAALMTVNAMHEPTHPLDANLLTTVSFGRRTCWGHGGFWGSVAIYCPDIDLAATITINQAEPRNPETLAILTRAFAAAIERRLEE